MENKLLFQPTTLTQYNWDKYQLVANYTYYWNRYTAEPEYLYTYYWNRYTLLSDRMYNWDRYTLENEYRNKYYWDLYNVNDVIHYNWKGYPATKHYDFTVSAKSAPITQVKTRLAPQTVYVPYYENTYKRYEAIENNTSNSETYTYARPLESCGASSGVNWSITTYKWGHKLSINNQLWYGPNDVYEYILPDSLTNVRPKAETAGYKLTIHRTNYNNYSYLDENYTQPLLPHNNNSPITSDPSYKQLFPYGDIDCRHNTSGFLDFMTSLTKLDENYFFYANTGSTKYILTPASYYNWDDGLVHNVLRIGTQNRELEGTFSNYYNPNSKTIHANPTLCVGTFTYYNLSYDDIKKTYYANIPGTMCYDAYLANTPAIDDEAFLASFDYQHSNQPIQPREITDCYITTQNISNNSNLTKTLTLEDNTTYMPAFWLITRQETTAHSYIKGSYVDTKLVNTPSKYPIISNGYSNGYWYELDNSVLEYSPHSLTYTGPIMFSVYLNDYSYSNVEYKYLNGPNGSFTNSNGLFISANTNNKNDWYYINLGIYTSYFIKTDTHAYADASDFANTDIRFNNGNKYRLSFTLASYNESDFTYNTANEITLSKTIEMTGSKVPLDNGQTDYDTLSLVQAYTDSHYFDKTTNNYQGYFSTGITSIYNYRMLDITNNRYIYNYSANRVYTYSTHDPTDTPTYFTSLSASTYPNNDYGDAYYYIPIASTTTYEKGSTILSTISSWSSGDYPQNQRYQYNGTYYWCYYSRSNREVYGKKKGVWYDEVVSDNPNEYPQDGQGNGWWFVYYGEVLTSDSHLIKQYTNGILVKSYVSFRDTSGLNTTPSNTGTYYVIEENQTGHGALIDSVSSHSINAYPEDGSLNGYWYEYDRTTSTITGYHKGNYIDKVSSTNENAYPQNGRNNDKWYIYSNNTVAYSQGPFDSAISSFIASSYPDNGYIIDDAWYIKRANTTVITSQLEITDSQLMGGVSFQQDINPSGDLQIGTCGSAQIDFTIYSQTAEQASAYLGKEFTYYTKGMNDDDWRQIGVFSLDSADRTGHLTAKLRGYDHIYNFDVVVDEWVDSLTFPITLGNMFGSLCEFVGVEAYSTVFPNSTFAVNDNFTGVNITGRTVLQYITEVSGGFCVAEPDGSIHIKNYQLPQNQINLNNSQYAKYTYEIYNVPVITSVIVRKDDNDDGVESEA